jgi:tetratricopeptide (TPR) repeat protein
MKTSRHAFVLAALLFSCARHLEVSVVKPPELDLRGVQHLLIGELQGPGARELQRDLWAALQPAGPSLLSPEAVRAALSERGLDAALSIDETLLPLLHESFPAAALLVGRVDTYHTDQAIETRQELDYDELGILRTYDQTRRRVWVNVEITFQLFDCRAGRVVALRVAKSKIDAVTDETRTLHTAFSKISEPPKIDERVLFAKARQQVVSAAVRAIAPHAEIEQATLYTQPGLPGLAEGVALARQRRWPDAIERFSSLAAEHPQNPKVFYNLGVAYKYNDQPREALAAFRRAFELSPLERYQREVKRCQTLVEEARGEES